MMTQIAPRTPPSFLGHEFNGFLFALVGTDRSGGQLSVVSALARLDLDAWAEAAALARLPRDAAVTKLSGMLRRFPEISHITQDSGAVAARLVALLPVRANPNRPSGGMSAGWAAGSGAAGIGILVALGLLLSLQYANRAHDQHASASTRPAASATPVASQRPAPRVP